MSRVEVRNLQSGQSVPASLFPGGIKAAYFADSFHRADQPFFVGTRWTCSFMEGDIQTFSTLADASINVAANALVIANSTAGGSIPKCFCIPIPMNSLAFNWGGQLAPAQFAEIRTLTTNLVVGGDAGFGLSLMTTMNAGICYSMRNANNGAVKEYFIERFVNGVNTTLVGPITPLNNNDVMRLEVVPAPTQNVLTYKINGVTIGTFTDNNAQRPVLGVPGLVTNGTAPGGGYSYDLFKCGTLPQVSTAIDFP